MDGSTEWSSSQLKAKGSTGPPIGDKKMADYLKDALCSTLDESVRKALVGKYPAPSNCELMQATRVDECVYRAILSESGRLRDYKLQLVDKSLTAALSALMPVQASIPADKNLSDAIKLLADAHARLVIGRREFVKLCLNPEYHGMCRPNLPFNTEMFGGEVEHLVKEMQAASKLSRKVKQSYSRSDSRDPKGNGWYRRQRRGSYHPNRGGYHQRPAYQQQWKTQQPPARKKKN